MANMIRKTVSPELTVSNSWLATKNTFARLSCGHMAFVCEGHHAELVKSEYPCELCGDLEKHKANIAEWQGKYDIHHTRARSFGGSYYITVYARDRTSPSGVIAIGSLPDIPELGYFLTGALAPLSPTEMLGGH